MSNFIKHSVIVECKGTGKTVYIKQFDTKKEAWENMKEIDFNDRTLYKKGINEVNTLFN